MVKLIKNSSIQIGNVIKIGKSVQLLVLEIKDLGVRLEVSGARLQTDDSDNLELTPYEGIKLHKQKDCILLGKIIEKDIHLIK